MIRRWTRQDDDEDKEKNKDKDKDRDKDKYRGRDSVLSYLVGFKVSFYARSKTSTHGACARFGTSVKRDLKGNKKREDEVTKRCALT